MMGYFERETVSMCPNGGCGDVGDKVVVKVKRCPAIAINGELLKDQCPQSKQCCPSGALHDHKIHLPNTFNSEFWVGKGCQLTIWPDIQTQPCAELLGHEGDGGSRVQGDNEKLALPRLDRERHARNTGQSPQVKLGKHYWAIKLGGPQ